MIDFEHENLESTPEKIAAIRSVRTDLWKPFRSALLRESDPLPVGETADRIIEFEGSIENADRLADDAVTNADRLANRAAALKRLQEEQDRRQQVADLYEGKELALSELEKEWQNLWKANGFVASKPRRMEGWLSQVNDLLERRAENREERRTLVELKGAIADVTPALQELARLVGIPEADKLPAEVLLSAIQDEIEKRAEAWRKSREVVTLAEASESRIEELEDQRISLQNAKREWKKSWIQVMVAMNLSPETALDEASAALEIWQQVPAALSQLEDRNRRVLGMKRDMEGFGNPHVGIVRSVRRVGDGNWVGCCNQNNSRAPEQSSADRINGSGGQYARKRPQI